MFALHYSRVNLVYVSRLVTWLIYLGAALESRCPSRDIVAHRTQENTAQDTRDHHAGSSPQCGNLAIHLF